MAAYPKGWTKREWIDQKATMVGVMQTLAARNYTMREIGKRLGLAPSTVHKYLSEAKRKNAQDIQRIQAVLK